MLKKLLLKHIPTVKIFFATYEMLRTLRTIQPVVVYIKCPYYMRDGDETHDYT